MSGANDNLVNQIQAILEVALFSKQSDYVCGWLYNRSLTIIIHIAIEHVCKNEALTCTFVVSENYIHLQHIHVHIHVHVQHDSRSGACTCTCTFYVCC